MDNNYKHKWRVFVGISLLSFGCYLDYTVVNIALPTIQRELHVNLTQLQWVMNIYFIALCILAAIMGRCGDIYGRRRLFYLGVSVFAIASLAAGLSPTIGWLIMGRLWQGIGAAIVFPLGPSLLPEAFPENERGKAIAWLGSLGGIALALGPMLGGLIVTYLGWRWIFYINVPIIIIGYLISFNYVKESIIINAGNRQLDWLGMLFLALSLGGLIMSLITSQTSSWFNLLTQFYLIVGVVSSVILVYVERNTLNPLIDFKDFSNLLFYAGALLCFLAGVLSATALFFNPLYLQVIRQQSPEFSGLVLFAIPVAVFIVAFTVEKFIKKLGIINTIITGFIFAILACSLQIFFTQTTPLWYIIIAFVFLGSVWAMGNTVPIIAAQNAVKKDRHSVATGTMITMFNIGGSIGLAIGIVVYHTVAASKLIKMFSLQTTQSDTIQFLQVNKFIANPAQTLQSPMSTSAHSLFDTAFMHGFLGVAWFILCLSIALLLSVLVFKKNKHLSDK